MRNRRTDMTAKAISLLMTLGFAATAACTGPSDETAGPADEAAAPAMSDSPGEAPGQDAAPGAEADTRIAQIAYIKASNPDFGDNFGAGSSAIGDDAVSLSADGMTLAVGAPFESSGAAGIDSGQADDSVYGAGAVYVFVPQGDTWVQQAYIKASNPGITDNFGFATALSADGNTLAVSAHFEAGGGTGVGADQNDDSIPQAGAVYLFTRTGTTWAQQAYIKASNTGHIGERLDPDDQPELAGEHFGPVASGEYSYADSYGEVFDDGDQFGAAIALSDDGNVLVATATAEDSGTPGVDSDQNDNSRRSAGAAYVFRREGTTWSQTAYIKPSNPEVDALFGYSVALSADGRRVAVGAYDEDGSPASTNEFQDGLVRGTGAVYVFDFDGETWRQTGYLKASNAERGDSLGVAVVISEDGRTVIATAQDEDGLSTGINNIPGLTTRTTYARRQAPYMRSSSRTAPGPSRRTSRLPIPVRATCSARGSPSAAMAACSWWARSWRTAAPRGSTVFRTMTRRWKQAPCICSPEPAAPGRRKRMSRARIPKFSTNSAVPSASAPTAPCLRWAHTTKTAPPPASGEIRATIRCWRPAPSICFAAEGERGARSE